MMKLLARARLNRNVYQLRMQKLSTAVSGGACCWVYFVESVVYVIEMRLELGL